MFSPVSPPPPFSTYHHHFDIGGDVSSVTSAKESWEDGATSLENLAERLRKITLDAYEGDAADGLRDRIHRADAATLTKSAELVKGMSEKIGNYSDILDTAQGDFKTRKKAAATAHEAWENAVHAYNASVFSANVAAAVSPASVTASQQIVATCKQALDTAQKAFEECIDGAEKRKQRLLADDLDAQNGIQGTEISMDVQKSNAGNAADGFHVDTDQLETAAGELEAVAGDVNSTVSGLARSFSADNVGGYLVLNMLSACAYQWDGAARKFANHLTDLAGKVTKAKNAYLEAESKNKEGMESAEKTFNYLLSGGNDWLSASDVVGIAQDQALGGTLGVATREAPDNDWVKVTKAVESVATKANAALFSGIGMASDARAGVPTDIAVASNLAALAPLAIVSIPAVAATVAASPVLVAGAAAFTIFGGLGAQHITENAMIDLRYGK